MINFIRYLLFIPLYLSNKLLLTYSKIVCLFDPGGFECKLEELYQKQINLKINQKRNYKNLKYKPKLYSKKKEIIFYTPTKISNYRANTLYSKERDTINWIDQFGSKNMVFFDIGANIGVYSLYCSMLYKNRVFAFEPQYSNITLLEKNIQINKLEKFISIIPNPIYNKNKLDFLLSDKNNLSGSASSTFIKKENIKSYEYKKRLTLSFAIDFLVEKLLIPKPNMIKIDVDGNEIDVIKGAIKTINSINCKTILIESFNHKTDKYVKSIFQEKFDLYSDSGINKIYIKKNFII
jgi:FkbM family methyltransferase